jgi:uncharacterized protein YbjT (DUF2867 family)
MTTERKTRTILIAGATGIVGRELARQLHARGDRVHALSRRPGAAPALAGVADRIVTGDATDPATLEGLFDGVDAVVSCLGAPVSFRLPDRRPFHAVDTVANRHLARAAARAGVERFVYLSVFLGPGWQDTAYVRAHERVVDELRAIGLSHAVVRATGIFPIFEPFLAMARRGIAGVVGDGQGRTNPVHPTEVAEACAHALDRTDEVTLPVGGPQVLTREEIVRMAFAAVGRPARILHVPRPVLDAAAVAVHPLHPRLGEMIAFGTAAFSHDFVAPLGGHRTLAEHFALVAGTDRAAVPV